MATHIWKLFRPPRISEREPSFESLQARNTLILATPDAEILSPERLGEHLAFKDRVAFAVLLATQTAFTVAYTEVRAFGQSGSDAQQKEGIPKEKGLFWACSAPAKCIRLTTTAVERNKHTARNLAGGIAGSVFYKPQFSFEVSGERAVTRVPSAPISFFLKEQYDPRFVLDFGVDPTAAGSATP